MDLTARMEAHPPAKRQRVVSRRAAEAAAAAAHASKNHTPKNHTTHKQRPRLGGSTPAEKARLAGSRLKLPLPVQLATAEGVKHGLLIGGNWESEKLRLQFEGRVLTPSKAAKVAIGTGSEVNGLLMWKWSPKPGEYHSLYDLAQMQPGERVLVLGASGGVGMAGIDLAVAAGCEVVACASSAEKLQACKEAGASILINYETDAGGDFKQALRDAGVYPLIDIVLDPVGGKWSETGVRSLRWGGRLVVVGFASGSTVPKEGIAKIPLNLALLNERKILVRHVVAKRC